MAHFAKVENGFVVNVIVAEQAFVDMLEDKDSWIQTSYNTRGGQHINGQVPLRKNYAGIGYAYDKERDAFISPKLFNSWILNDDTCLWEPPIPYPTDGKDYVWDESIVNWVETTPTK